jgi:hypothetical protein
VLPQSDGGVTQPPRDEQGSTSPSQGPDTVERGQSGFWPEWLRDPRQWASDVFAQSVISLFQGIATLLRSAIDTILASSANFVTRTPPSVSYDSPTVRGLWSATRGIANAALVLVALVGGFNLLARGQLGEVRDDAVELLCRLAIGALAANTSLWWGQLFVEINNALCAVAGQATLPAWERAETTTHVLANVLASFIYLVMGLLLVLQQLMRLALVDVLLLLAPLACVCWVLPQTRPWYERWDRAFFCAVFVQFLQVAALKLGSALLLELTPQGEDAVVVGVLLGIAVLALTLKLPDLVQGHLGDGLGFARYYAYRRGARAIDAARTAVGGRVA